MMVRRWAGTAPGVRAGKKATCCLGEQSSVSGAKMCSVPCGPLAISGSSWGGRPWEDPIRESCLPGCQRREAVGAQPGTVLCQDLAAAPGEESAFGCQPRVRWPNENCKHPGGGGLLRSKPVYARVSNPKAAQSLGGEGPEQAQTSPPPRAGSQTWGLAWAEGGRRALTWMRDWRVYLGLIKALSLPWKLLEKSLKGWKREILFGACDFRRCWWVKPLANCNCIHPSSAHLVPMKSSVLSWHSQTSTTWLLRAL